MDAARDVIGFCTLEPFNSLLPFSQTAEVMYFLKDGYTGKGLGKAVLRKLEADAKEHMVIKLIAEITDDNKSSISFHLRNGFVEYGRLDECWTKFHQTLGIVYMKKEVA